MATVVAYWLLPSEPTRKFFTQTIDQLATRFEGPIFTPHLTVFIAPEKSRKPAELLRELGAVAINLSATDISFSDQFTKTLFVRFRSTDALQQLNATVERLTGAPKYDLAEPHVSLLYKDLPTETKRELAASIQLLLRDVAFDSICAMRCVSPTQTAADVRAWKLA